MGKLTDSMGTEIQNAMKSGDTVKLATFRLLASALSYEKIAKLHDLSDDEELEVVKREAKKRQDAVEAYEKVGQPDRAEAEKSELAILKAYLPEDMSSEEVVAVVTETIKELGATNPSDMGRVMGAVQGKVKGRADGKMIADMVRDQLTK